MKKLSVGFLGGALAIFATYGVWIVLSKQLNVSKPYAQVLIAQSEEDDDEECTPEICGDEDDEEPYVPTCKADTWDCSWSECTPDGVKTATKCTLTYDCPTAKTPQPTKTVCRYVAPEPTCKEDTWSCGEWNSCSEDGVQTRSCKITSDCKEANTASPATSQKCTPPLPPEPTCKADTWNCSWSECTPDGVKTATKCTLSYDCPTVNTPQPTKTVCKYISPPLSDEEQKKLEEQKRLEEEKRAAEEAAAKKAAEEEAARKAAEEEEAKKLAEEEALRKQQEEEAKKLEEEIKKQLEEEISRIKEEELRREIEENEKFKAIVAEEEKEAAPADVDDDKDNDGIKDLIDSDPSNPDTNHNGVPDGIDLKEGLDLTKPDEEEVQLRVQEQLEVKRLVAQGVANRSDAEKTVKKQFRKPRAEKKVKKIRTVAQKSYNRKIQSNKDDCNADGVSDEQAIAMGLNPCEKVLTAAAVSPAEAKLYGATSKTFGKKVTTSIFAGYKLSRKGFTVLASCPSNASLTLYLTDKNGKKAAVETKTCAENNKVVFAVDQNELKNLKTGRYLAQVQRAASTVSFTPAASDWFASVLNTDTSTEASLNSDPVLVDMVEDPDVPQPIVKDIQGIDVAGLRDIQISATADGKVRVTGVSDIGTTVVGTFQSAVFTSALLADVEGGSFEVVSPRALEKGEHEVVIYATRPEEATQSEPVKLRFRIVETAQAASSETEVTTGGTEPQKEPSSRPSADTSEKAFPLIPVVGGVAVVLILVGLGVFLKKRKPSA